MTYYPGLTVELAEQLVIEGAYKWFRGNKTQAALAVGLTVKTFHLKLEKYDADRAHLKTRMERATLEREEQLRRARGLPSASPGIRVESAAQAPAEPSLPVPERKEVQEVLPRQAAKGSSKRQSERI